MLFVTTSNGVFCLDTERRHLQCLLHRKHARGLFRSRSRGYFGIARHPATGQVLIASRERGSRLLGKLATGVTLHLIDASTLASRVLASVNDVHDVHQIACHGDYVLLTDTGRNRIVAVNLQNGRRLNADIGALREDINHINALAVHDDTLYVGLNNRGLQPAVVLHLPIRDFFAAAAHAHFELTAVAEQIELGTALHTHDLEPTPNGRLFACKSYDGSVFEIGAAEDWLKLDGWTRGLAFSPSGLWVGNSGFADRKQRHDERLDGSVSLYAWPQPQRLDHWLLSGAGQVNDLLYVEKP